MFLSKEDEYKKQLEHMEKELAAAKEALTTTKDFISPIPQAEPKAEGFIDVSMQGPASEAESTEETEQAPEDDETALSNAKKELRELIDQSLDPILKECMEWERRILHSANLVFFECSDAYKSYNKPTLPYALIKHEQLKTKERLTPNCSQEEIGGYAPITLDQWRTRAVLENQPTWRITWFRKHPSAITTYARAPREFRIDPCYCPVRRRRNWADFERIKSTRPTWLNYPLLPAPEDNRPSTENYMITLWSRWSTNSQESRTWHA